MRQVIKGLFSWLRDRKKRVLSDIGNRVGAAARRVVRCLTQKKPTVQVAPPSSPSPPLPRPSSPLPSWLKTKYRWVIDNRKWVFSGIGVLFITALFAFTSYLFRCLNPSRDTSARYEAGRDIFHVEGDQYYAQRDFFYVNGDLRLTSPPSPDAPLLMLHQVPPPPHDFTGREKELAELERQIKEGAVGIFGMQGTGKTALAYALTAGIADRFPDAQIYLDLKGSAQPGQTALSGAEILRHIIQTFQPTVRLPEKEAELRPRYYSVLKGKCVLLLMDNAAGPEQIEPLLPVPEGCALIVTSRKRFHFEGLHPLDLSALRPEEARELLIRLAPRLGDAAPELAKVCGCFPLALRQAAGAVNERPDLEVREHLARLTDWKGRAGLIEGPIAYGLSLVSESTRVGWRQLAVFPGRFDRKAAAAVWGVKDDAAADRFGELLRYCLIEWDELNKRYHLQDAVHDYAVQQLAGTERDLAERRHAAYYCQVLSQGDSLYLEGGEKVLQGLALFDREWENIRTGQAWAAAHAGDDEFAARLSARYPDAGAYCLNLRLHPRDWIAWFESSLTAARKLGDRRGEGCALGNSGNAYFRLGDPHHAIEFHKQSLAILREIGDRRGEGGTLCNLGNAYAVLGKTRRAIEFYEQALAIARGIGNRREEGNALGNLGAAYADLGETRRAIEFYEQALVIFRETRDRHSEGIALCGLGMAYACIGDPRRAIEYHEQALSIAREIRNRLGEGEALDNLGNAYLDLGNSHRAIELHEQALAIAREFGNRMGEGNALGNLGNAYSDLGDPRRAIEFYEQDLAIAREIGARRGEGDALGNLGTAYLDLGDPRRAIGFHEQRLIIAREIGDRRGEGCTLWNRALALDQLGRRDEAIASARDALAIYEQIEDPAAAEVRKQLQDWGALPR